MAQALDSLTTLDLGATNMCQWGAQRLAQALNENRSLTSLKLDGNCIGNRGMKYLADALKINSTLTVLDIRTNAIDSVNLDYLAKALEKNMTVLKIRALENRQPRAITVILDRNLAALMKQAAPSFSYSLKNYPHFIPIEVIQLILEKHLTGTRDEKIQTLKILRQLTKPPARGAQ